MWGGGLALALLACLFPALAAALSWNLDAALDLAFQSYDSDEISEQLLASDAEATLRGQAEGPWEGSLRLGHREDLYTQSSSAVLDLDYLGESLGLQAEVLLERSEPGRLNDLLLWFDPDDLESQIAADASYEQAALRAGLSWISLGWDGRLGTVWIAQRYDEPGEVLSDSQEGRIEGALGLSLPREGRLDMELCFLDQSYEQRPASDEQDLACEARAAFPLRENWELALLGELRQHAVRDEEGIAYYERPSGRVREIGFGLDYFGLGRGELALEASIGREEWSGYEGYYNDGWEQEVELLTGMRLGEDTRLDFFVAGAFFDPDSLQTTAWTLRRVQERRLEGDLFLRHGGSGRFPLGLGLLAEQFILSADEDDSFLLLQGELDLGWRPGTGQLWQLHLSLDQYRSRYAGEEEEREWGWSGRLTLQVERKTWTLEGNLERQQRYSFLEDTGPIVDWETGVRIRWHP